MNNKPTYRFVTVEVETILGESEERDSQFFEYLNEYSISHTVLEDKGESGWPVVKYTGGPVSLSNMLREKFGMNPIEVLETYPQIKSDEQESNVEVQSQTGKD